MAKISAHGETIGTVYFLKSAKRYMSDGVILRNQGFGWKIAGKLQDPRLAYESQLHKQEEAKLTFPANFAYRKLLHSTTGLCNRWKLHAAISAMPDDPDGAWSEACDGYGNNASADIEDVVKLCRLYKLAVAEYADHKNQL